MRSHETHSTSGWRAVESWGGAAAGADDKRSLVAVSHSDGLLVAHVPDLGRLGLLVQQGQTGQVFQEGM